MYNLLKSSQASAEDFFAVSPFLASHILPLVLIVFKQRVYERTPHLSSTNSLSSPIGTLLGVREYE